MTKNGNDKKTIAGFFGSALLFVAAASMVMAGVFGISRRADEEGANTLRNGIRRASVQCYAIEGRYPPSVGYLTEHYGIRIDENRYSVFYDGFASNIMPDITVVPVTQNE